MRIIKRVAVFCASSGLIGDSYAQAAQELGKILAQQNITIVYGGGAVGLMGHLADSALAHQGEVIGVIPQFMVDLEWAHPGVNNMVIVETMRERKKIMIEKSDAVIGLPGGSGTLEELLETISLKRLGLYVNPIILLNTQGFYSLLNEIFMRCVEERFMRPEHLNIWSVAEKPEDILNLIETAPTWSADAVNQAVLK
jgi:uncharacterized protein (TIGR00730 family)